MRFAILALLGLIASSTANAQRDANLDVVVSATPTAAVRVPALNGFTVCVGTESQHDLYGRQATTTTGTARLTGLPRGNAVITVQKVGYAGNQAIVNLVGSAPNSATRVSLRMAPGSGGPTCPRAPVTTIALPPSPPPTRGATPIANASSTTPSSINPTGRPERLGEEMLAWHGELYGTTNIQTLDCKSSGTNFVMVGIQGKSGQAVDELQLVCAPLLRDGTLGLGLRVTARAGGGGGVPFTPRRCGRGEAVSGIGGDNHTYTQLRRLIVHCRALNSSALGVGSSRQLDPVGSSANTVPWDPDNCTSNRPARALVVDISPFRGDLPIPQVVDVVAAVRLICEQPVRPTL